MPAIVTRSARSLCSANAWRLVVGMSLGLALCPIARAADASSAAPAAPTVERPTGEYQTAWLDLTSGGARGRLFLAFRAGKGVQAWAVGHSIPGGPKPGGFPSLVCDENTVTLNGATLKGAMRFRLVSSWAPAANLATYTVTFNGAITDGTYALETAKGEKAAGQFKGTLSTETDLAKSFAFAKGKGWPSYLGDGESGHGMDSGRTLVDDPAKMRLLWRSEETSLTGWGNTADDRYASNVMYNALGGGASTPISQDGRIYLYYFSPNKASSANDKARALFEEAKKKSSDPNELAAAERFWASKADVVVVCMDGVSGKTIWKSTWPLKQGNFQTHKWRGNNPTPVIAEGTLFVTDYDNRTCAYDAATGDLKWEYGAIASTMTGNNVAWRGPVLAGGVVVVGGGKTVGLDPKTGKQVWTGPGGGNFKKWTTGGKSYILVESALPKEGLGTQITCLDTSDGKQLWTAKTEIAGNGVWEHPLVVGDRLLGVRLDAQPGNDGNAKVTAYKLSPQGIEPAWQDDAAVTIVDKAGLAASESVVYASYGKEVRAFDIATGKLLGRVEGVGGARTHHMQVVDGRLILDPEGRHGSTTLFFFNAEPKAFKLLGGEWSGGYATTTAYANMPLYHPVDDGRLFMRGRDGIYAFDMRSER